VGQSSTFDGNGLLRTLVVVLWRGPRPARGLPSVVAQQALASCTEAVDEGHRAEAGRDAVPGPATEAASLDALVAKLREMIPELQELDDNDLSAEVSFELLARSLPRQRLSR